MTSIPTFTSARFAGKVALVTGSSSGLGEALAIHLAREGAFVTITGRDETRLKAVQAKCQAAADEVKDTSVEKAERVLAVVGDVTKTEVRKELVEKTVKTFGRLDVLINNAGIFSAQDGLDNATEDKFDEIMSVNVKTGFFLVQLAAPHLEKTKGNVLFVSSSLSFSNWPACAVYCASKAAVDNLVGNLALALGPRGVRVNSVNPGYIPTLAVREFAPSMDQVEAVARGRKEFLDPKHPLKGECVGLDEFTDAALFLASDQSRVITGHRLPADAGFSLHSAATAPSV